ncbi:MAG: bestrophin family ion channel [Bacteroidota bacterium]
MIITRHLRLKQILRLTWKTDLFLIFSCGLTYLIDVYVIPDFVLPAMFPTLLGTALAFFIGFMNNQAYDRWWEARKIWGALVNDSRSWTRGVLHYCAPVSEEDQPTLTQVQTRMVHRHISFLYALKSNLRSLPDNTYHRYLSQEEATQVDQQSNVHNAILVNQSKDLEWLSRQGIIDGFRFMELNQMIVRFCDSMGKSERIKNTVFPTTYYYFNNLFIWFFVILITLVSGQTIGPWSILFGWLIGFVFHTTHLIGVSILDPFENVPTGISLNQITRTIEINLLQMLGETDIPQPVQPINDVYVM